MKNKKVKPLVILSVMVLVLVSIGVIFYTRESSKKLKNTNSERVFEKSDIKSDTKEDVIDSKKEEDQVMINDENKTAFIEFINENGATVQNSNNDADLKVSVSSAEMTERVAKAKLMEAMFELGREKGIPPQRLRFKINGIEE